MSSLKGLNLNAFNKRAQLPAPRLVPNGTKEFEAVVKHETQMADAEIAVTDAILDSTPGDTRPAPPEEENISSESEKLARLIDDDFPFDESQLTAVYGMIKQQYACMIGAAGTGKTTLEKKLVDLLRDGLEEVDLSDYWKRGVAADDDDSYEAPEKLVDSILMCSFTGRSTQMTKKNFPREWHGNIMTIHRALGFYPEFYPDVDAETGQMVNKRRFVPAYTAENKMPWKIILIDEAGMLGLDLWHQLWAACEPDTRIYLVGDINQLPPTHGKSILGFALSKWPVFELTHVHRQQGANNSIVDNAHRVLKGLRPVSDSPKNLSVIPDMSASDPKAKLRPMLETLTYMTQNKDWRFLTVEIEAEHKVAAVRIRHMLKLLHGKIYEPNRDFLITPINGFEQTSPGFALGQQPMNQELVTVLNQDEPRYIIDAGRERQNFAVGDKVMATINDYEAGITNGMTGIIKSIAENGAYIGDTRRFGLISEVNEYMEGLLDEDDDDVDFNLTEMVSDSQAGMDALKNREKKEAGPASHSVTVVFGEDDHAFEVNFDSKSQVASLQLAYAATCHKLQGGEAPLVFVIVHNQHKRPLNREWLYTAITRGSQRVVLLMTKQGVGLAVSKQNIKGATLKAKIASFAALTADHGLGATVRVKLPHPRSLVQDVEVYQPKEIQSAEAQAEIQEREASCEQTAQTAERAQAESNSSRPAIRVGSLHIHIHRDREQDRPNEVREEQRVKDGGELRRVPDETERGAQRARERFKALAAKKPAQLAAPQPRLVSQIGAARTAVDLGYVKFMSQRLLPAPSAPEEKEDVRRINIPNRAGSLASLLRARHPLADTSRAEAKAPEQAPKANPLQRLELRRADSSAQSEAQTLKPAAKPLSIGQLLKKNKEKESK